MMNFPAILSLPLLLSVVTPGLTTPPAPAFPTSLNAPLVANVQLSCGVAPNGLIYYGPAC